MVTNSYLLWSEEEYSYPMAFGFVPNIVSYIHDEDDAIRPAIIVVPGGGYCSVAPTEGEIVALEFYQKGYNTFVLTYTTNLLMSTPLKTQPMKDLSRALRIIRKDACDLKINPNQVAVCGFSAGGHLCGSVTVHYDDIAEENELYQRYSNRPDATILSYPVITFGEKAHKDSFKALLGADASPEELAYMSLEKHVKETTPPVFLWHTVTDEAVPVENSYLFAESCREKGVAYEQHIFTRGDHGLSLANHEWASGKFGGFYTLQQNMNIIEEGKKGKLQVPVELIKMFEPFLKTGENVNPFNQNENKADEAVAMWPILADLWLRKIFC